MLRSFSKWRRPARARQMAERELAAGTGATQRLKAMWRAMSAREDALRREFLE